MNIKEFKEKTLYMQRAIEARIDEIAEIEARLFEKIKVYQAEKDYNKRKFLRHQIKELQGVYSRFCV